MVTADTRTYWERRLAQRFSLAGVGYLGLGRSYNTWMYRVRRVLFTRRLRPVVAARREIEVLDVGSGTGFYVDLWQELGVRSVTGSDLTEAAVARLRERRPEIEFVRFELGSDDNPLADRCFDVISAMDVLFHVVDDARYRRALATLAGLLRPGGLLVLTDNLLQRATIRAPIQVSRSLVDVEAALSQAGLVVVSRRPSFVLMNAPIDSDSRLLRTWWRALTGFVRLHEAVGWTAGALLFPVELLLASRLAESPTTEMMLCRKLDVTRR